MVTSHKPKYLDLPSRPRWDRDGGLWYTSPTIGKDGKMTLYRWRPTVNFVCEPLMLMDLRLARRRLLYREALELVIVFKQRSDLFTLALHRRQVATYGIPLDHLFLSVAEGFDPPLSAEEWRRLAERMPEKSFVRKACLEHAQEAK